MDTEVTTTDEIVIDPVVETVVATPEAEIVVE